MAGASGFYTGSAGEWSSAVSSFNIFNGVESFIGYEKAGGTNDLANTVDGVALRQKKFTGVTVATTGTTVAHGLTDSAGNPVVPRFVVQLAAPAAGDSLESYQEPDATNLYLSSSASGSYDFLAIY